MMDEQEVRMQQFEIRLLNLLQATQSLSKMIGTLVEAHEPHTAGERGEPGRREPVPAPPAPSAGQALGARPGPAGGAVPLPPAVAANRLRDPALGLRVVDRVLAAKHHAAAPRTQATAAAKHSRKAVGRLELAARAATAADDAAVLAFYTLCLLYMPEPSPILAELRSAPQPPTTTSPTIGTSKRVPEHVAVEYLHAVGNWAWEDMMFAFATNERFRPAYPALLRGDSRPLLRVARAETPYVLPLPGR